MNLENKKRIGLYVFEDSECKVQYRMFDSNGPVAKFNLDDLALEFVKRNDSDKDFNFINGMYKINGIEHCLDFGGNEKARHFTREEMISFLVNIMDYVEASRNEGYFD